MMLGLESAADERERSIELGLQPANRWPKSFREYVNELCTIETRAVLKHWDMDIWRRVSLAMELHEYRDDLWIDEDRFYLGYWAHLYHSGDWV